MGRDVESIVRDLVEIAIDMVRDEKLDDVEEKAEMNAEDRLLDLLLPPVPSLRRGLADLGGAAAAGSRALGIKGD